MGRCVTWRAMAWALELLLLKLFSTPLPTGTTASQVAVGSGRAGEGMRLPRSPQSPVRIDASPGLGKNSSSQSGRSGMTTSVVMPGRYRRVST
jgi:hypothetical protein